MNNDDFNTIAFVLAVLGFLMTVRNASSAPAAAAPTPSVSTSSTVELPDGSTVPIDDAVNALIW